MRSKVSDALKKARIARDKDKVAIYSSLIAEFDRKGKDLTEEEELAILKKVIKGATECKNEEEVKLLSEFMPTMMTEEEILTAFKSFSGVPNNIGACMGLWKKSEFNGKADMKLVSKVVRENFM